MIPCHKNNERKGRETRRDHTRELLLLLSLYVIRSATTTTRAAHNYYHMFAIYAPDHFGIQYASS
jgi:hypothetical protein